MFQAALIGAAWYEIQHNAMHSCPVFQTKAAVKLHHATQATTNRSTSGSLNIWFWIHFGYLCYRTVKEKWEVGRKEEGGITNHTQGRAVSVQLSHQENHLGTSTSKPWEKKKSYLWLNLKRTAEFLSAQSEGMVLWFETSINKGPLSNTEQGWRSINW